jgi:hypothetical protein
MQTSKRFVPLFRESSSKSQAGNKMHSTIPETQTKKQGAKAKYALFTTLLYIFYDLHMLCLCPPGPTDQFVSPLCYLTVNPSQVE